MKIDLCKVFGVEEGEEFELSHGKGIYRVNDNGLLEHKQEDDWIECVSFNSIINSKVTKKYNANLRHELFSFTSEYPWVKYIAKDENGTVNVYVTKPLKGKKRWWSNNYSENFACIDSIQWEDEEPVFIDDYVERGVSNE